MILMLDNYDSFTWNLVQYLGELGAEVHVVRNDQISVQEVVAMQPERIVLSPGPCTPDEAGICLDLVRELAGKLPILGVCLGHQAIVQALGGRVVRASRVMHGKLSDIHHRGQGVFRDLPTPFSATRYHSLVVDHHTLPAEFEVTAWCEHSGFEAIMGIRHRHYTLEGVQFHPESILSEHGHLMLRNFLVA